MLRFSHAIAVGVVASSFLFACGDKINPAGDYSQPTGGSTAGTTGDAGSGGAAGSVTYTNGIKALLDKNCATSSCHVSSSALPYPLDTYANAKSGATAANKAIQDGTMPLSGPLSDSDKKLFQTWVDQGTQQ